MPLLLLLLFAFEMLLWMIVCFYSFSDGFEGAVCFLEDLITHSTCPVSVYLLSQLLRK